MKKFVVLIVTILSLTGCRQTPAVPNVDPSKVRTGMSGSDVRKALGEPFPGASNTNTATGYRQETWIYPSGDNALFVIMENDRVKSVNLKRVTMKDAAKKVKVGMTQQEVVSALGQPSGSTGDIRASSTATYVNDEAALDDLTIHYENGIVTKTQVNVNSALSR